MPHRNIGINPGVPAVPDLTFDDPNLQQGYDALKESIELLAGVRGDPNYRALTYGEATENGTTELFATNIVLAEAAASQGTLRLEGDITGVGIFTNTGNVTAQTAINLPNVVCIDGGTATETYPGAVTGPYGVQVAGGGGVPDGGTAGQLLIKQSATDGDALWQTWGPSPGNAVYCPNYPYTFINTSAWKIVGIDATLLFSPSRRCYFIDGENTYFGNVLSSGFASNETTITMSMDAGNSLTNTVSEVCLQTDGTGWTPSVDDPFSGTQITDIMSGAIGATQWWVIIGTGGRLATSTDAGVTWTVRTSGTTENLNQIDYHSATQTFIAGGDGGVIVRSTNGSTWTANTSEIAAIVSGGTGDIGGMCADEQTSGAWICYFNGTAASAVYTAYSTDDGVNWVGGSTSLGSTYSNYQAGFHQREIATGPSQIMYSYSEDVQQLSNYSDTTGSSLYNTSAQPAVRSMFSVYFDNFSNDILAKGTNLNRGTTITDDVTFSASNINDITVSNVHNRLVAVGEDGKIGTYEMSEFDAGNPLDFLHLQSNGGNPLSDYLCVRADDTDGVIIAGNQAGQIVRSTNGLGKVETPTTYTGTFALETADPFSGGKINRIETGVISGTQWWVIIGDNGQLATSTNKGVTWTVRTTNTTENLLCIGFNPTNQQFFVGCTNGEYLYSTTGTTWTRDSTTIAALSVAGSNDIRTCAWNATQNTWYINFVATTLGTTCRIYNSPIALTTWTASETSVSTAPIGVGRVTPGTSNYVYPEQTSGSDFNVVTSNTDTTDSVYIGGSLVGVEPSAIAFGDGTDGNAFNCLAGWSNGKIGRYSGAFATSTPTARGYVILNNADPRVTASRVNGIAFSSTEARWVWVCDAGEIYACENSAFDTSHNWWSICGNSFVGDVTDVARNDTDGYFIAVSDIGEIGRSTDGVS
jgi:hypothetical protein